MASVTVSFNAVPSGENYDDEGYNAVYGVATISGTYTSTKVPLTASTFGFDRLDYVEPGTVYGSGTFLIPYWDSDNDRILLGANVTGTALSQIEEVAATTDVDGFTFNVRARGKDFPPTGRA